MWIYEQSITSGDTKLLDRLFPSSFVHKDTVAVLKQFPAHLSTPVLLVGKELYVEPAAKATSKTLWVVVVYQKVKNAI